ncbi:MAG: 4-phosphopantoate--beta-alanine ligase [Candidatus Asgardarchaeia archaeon]
MHIPPDHPRAESLRIRHELIDGFKRGVVTQAGLIAHGRGEAFDYLIGEKTTDNAMKAMRAAVAALLLAKHPVISVNGNTAALVPEYVVKLSKETNARIEVNLFYRSKERELAIRDVLLEAGANEVLGVGERASATIPELSSLRRKVDPDGILIADTVLVPLEDGDRTEALRKMRKNVIAIDLNPLSRTARYATITIVDNIVRCMPKMVELAKEMKGMKREELKRIVDNFDNGKNLSEAVNYILKRLKEISEKLKLGDLEI